MPDPLSLSLSLWERDRIIRDLYKVSNPQGA